jgi:pimeloyl-ACP methyl ester carboxylesterase
LAAGVQIDHENAILCGHSMGGGTVIKAAQDIPEFKLIVSQDEIILPFLKKI